MTAPNEQDVRPGPDVDRSASGEREQEERAFCVRCGEPTEHPASTPGATLCPVCEWQEAERVACSCT
ncbi:hypothetical protein GCM10010405_36620 [Streptomyces macrosporus]|uniref:Small CPxCG-related zinc finger protein n=1 Tax=Streptomyces macrosporus TaxID=44032 RepID=A0ABP5X9X8_9ACTN